jgi:predicted TIM-barrel fold metal-dependent hydrolase
MHVIDTHVHFSLIDPNHRASGFLKRIKKSVFGQAVAETLRKIHRTDNYLVTPFQWQPFNLFYQAATLSSLPVNGSMDESDLMLNMQRNGFSHAVVIFYSQFQDVVKLSQKIRDSGQFIWGTTVNGNLDVTVQEEALDYIHRGASCLYFHPMSDRRIPESSVYDEITRVAVTSGIPVILRTGYSQIPGQKESAIAHLSRWLPLIRRYSGHPFVISHSNMTDPLFAIETVAKFDNLVLDMAWQNPWVFKKSFEKLGSTKMMLASDWPVFGDTMSIQRRLLSARQLSNADAENIAYRNAQALFKTFKL